jgi:DNA-binding PadR family transcriptional regulator
MNRKIYRTTRRGREWMAEERRKGIVRMTNIRRLIEVKVKIIGDGRERVQAGLEGGAGGEGPAGGAIALADGGEEDVLLAPEKDI